jgi:NLI interacting factor-like phosphatase
MPFVLQVSVVIDRHPVRFFVHKRPHVDFFLDIVSQWYDLVVFTASMEIYGAAVADKLDNGRNILNRRWAQLSSFSSHDAHATVSLPDITDNTVHQISVPTRRTCQQFVVIWIEYSSSITRQELIVAFPTTPYQSKRGSQVLIDKHVAHFIITTDRWCHFLLFRSHRYFSPISSALVGRSKIHTWRALSALTELTPASSLLVCNCKQNDIRKILHRSTIPPSPAPAPAPLTVMLFYQKINFVRARVSVNLINNIDRNEQNIVHPRTNFFIILCFYIKNKENCITKQVH